jgi:hypothetical protein
MSVVYWVGPDGNRTLTRPDRPIFIDMQWVDGNNVIIEFHYFEFDF